MATPRHLHQVVYPLSSKMIATTLFVAAPVIFFYIFARSTNMATSVLFADIGTSLFRITAAFFIALFLGWVFAVISVQKRVAGVALPVFDVLQSVPSFAALPIAVLYWGATNFTVITFMVLAIIWPILFSVISSLKLVRQEYHEAVQVFGLRGWKKLWYFILPASVPGLITGTIVGLGEAWEAIIATEIIVGTKTGLGSFFSAFSDSPRMTFLGIGGLLLIVFSINKIFLLPLLDKSHSLHEE